VVFNILLCDLATAFLLAQDAGVRVLVIDMKKVLRFSAPMKENCERA
jgi:hypothetical protein